MAALPFIAMGLQVAGSAVSAMGTIAGGRAAEQAGMLQQQAMEYRAKQEEIAANQSRAEAQRAAFEKQREGRLLLSQLVARAAAGGGGVDDPTTLNLGGNIKGRAEYNVLLEMYKGENRARGLEDSATASRYTGMAALYEGQAKRQAATSSALGTIISGAGSVFGGSRNLRFGFGTDSSGNPMHPIYGSNPYTPDGRVNPVYG